MKAKDTVINLTDMGNYSLKIAMTSILGEQAEITWDKAIREVVEWLETVKSSAKTAGGAIIFVPTKEEWQAKLKEWGIK